MSTPKTCRTCAHRRGVGEFAQCDYTGRYADLSRASGDCPPDFAPWKPREGIVVRILQFFFGCIEDTPSRESRLLRLHR
jgi:hypothetical protein